MRKISLQKVKDIFLRKKKIIIPILIVVVIISFFFFGSQKSSTASSSTVKYADLTRSVRATGQVISNTNLDLSFNKGSVVKSVRVKVGDKVSAYQILATLDQGQELAKLTQAEGALLGAEAKYQKILEGASGEEVALSEVALRNAISDLENTKSNQATLVASAYQTLLNSSIVATSSALYSSQPTPVISGTYTLEREGEIKMSAGPGSFSTAGLVSSSGEVSTILPQPIGNSGLFILFSTAPSSVQDWTISIPNKKATNYLTNYNAYQTALETQTSAVGSAQSLVNQRQAELNLKKAATRDVDLDIAKAEVLSAEGSLQSARSTYEDTVIRAPAPGTITRVDIKYGELASLGQPVITLEDVDNLYIEALINEANIAYLKIGQSADITFDAFSNAEKFTGKVVQIDPSAETNDGVVNYKIKVSIEEENEIIRPGMNANVNISSGEAKDVLAIPKVAVRDEGSRQYVHVIVDEKNKKYEKREVTTGFVGDNNLVEIKTGLTLDEKVSLIEEDASR